MLEIGENRSSPLCECCDEVDFEVLKSLENEVNKFDVSRRKNVSFPEIRVDELENRIPRRIDNGFTNSTRDALVSSLNITIIQLNILRLSLSFVNIFSWIGVGTFQFHWVAAGKI